MFQCVASRWSVHLSEASRSVWENIRVKQSTRFFIRNISAAVILLLPEPGGMLKSYLFVLKARLSAKNTAQPY